MRRKLAAELATRIVAAAAVPLVETAPASAEDRLKEVWQALAEHINAYLKDCP